MMPSNEFSILLIDDDADVLDAYTLLLEQAGYRIFVCNNPLDAQQWIEKDWPGIVLSDVCMPGCSGIDLMTLLHRDDKQLPILLITGHGDVPMAVEAVKKGAWDFLQKPVDPGKLLTLVDAALRKESRLSPAVYVTNNDYRSKWWGEANGRSAIGSVWSNSVKRILPSGFTGRREPGA
jgi:Response regulator containing CheY-like receiver, AAA-type ATPase, and DNA-binding domains